MTPAQSAAPRQHERRYPVGTLRPCPTCPAMWVTNGQTRQCLDCMARYRRQMQWVHDERKAGRLIDHRRLAGAPG